MRCHGHDAARADPDRAGHWRAGRAYWAGRAGASGNTESLIVAITNRKDVQSALAPASGKVTTCETSIDRSYHGKNAYHAPAGTFLLRDHRARSCRVAIPVCEWRG